MTQIVTRVRRFFAQDSAATMVEYAIMVALIAVVCIAAVQLLGTNVNTKYSAVGNSLT